MKCSTAELTAPRHQISRNRKQFKFNRIFQIVHRSRPRILPRLRGEVNVLQNWVFFSVTAYCVKRALNELTSSKTVRAELYRDTIAGLPLFSHHKGANGATGRKHFANQSDDRLAYASDAALIGAIHEISQILRRLDGEIFSRKQFRKFFHGVFPPVPAEEVSGMAVKRVIALNGYADRTPHGHLDPMVQSGPVWNGKGRKSTPL